MSQSTSPLAVLGDIGGTTARFTLLWASGKIDAPTNYPTCDQPTFERALETFVHSCGLPAVPRTVAIAGAGPLTKSGIALTNCPWTITFTGLKKLTDNGNAHIVNDFTAIALSLPALTSKDALQVGTGTAVPGRAMAVLGAGTGLGVSGLVPSADGVLNPLGGEGGHRTLSATTEREWRVVETLTRRFGHASAERALSGPGLVNIYEALCNIDCRVEKPHTPIGIAELAFSNDPLAAEAVELFTGWLGAVAGDLALTLGAQGGTFIAGGIVPGWGARFDGHLFRQRFEAKGRFQPLLATIPTSIITAPVPAFLGLGRLVANSH
ncbi:MAG: glucokinase [Chromatiales bacterium]|jgi:glucokinase|nr:glucokinase [Chromatiales bacterium]